MSIQSYFYLDTPASRHALRDVLVQADIGLDAAPDWKHLSGAVSAATNVSISDDLDWQVTRPDNGVVATSFVNFSFRKESWEEYDTQTVRGVTALLKAFPDADAYWVSLDAEIPMLLRRKGRLVLAQEQTAPGYFWDSARQPSFVAMVDLPYIVMPLGPWNDIPAELQAPKRLQQPVVG